MAGAGLVNFNLTYFVFFASFNNERVFYTLKKKTNFEIKNKHFLDTSPGYDLFQEVHTQIRRAGNILTIGFLEREEKMTSRCDISL